MKVTCTQEAFSRGLSVVGRAVAARSTLPITSHVLITTEDDGKLRLSATNLEITMNYWIEAEILEPGAAAVPARLLTDFVNTLPVDRITLELAARSRQLKVECARNEAQISGLDAEDFPPTPVVQDGIDVQLEAKGLRQAIAQTVFAAATDDSRPVLTGVDTKFEGNLLTLAASDGFRLSVYKLPLTASVDATEIVVPSRAFAELSRLLAEEDEAVTLRTNAAKTQVLFRLANAEMVAQLIQGTFPNFNQLIPASSTSRAVAEVGEFLRETRTASVFARDGSGIVRLVVTPGEGVTPGKIVISARAEEVGDNEGEIDAAVEGEGVKIAFNGKYLQDVLQALESGQLAMETTGPSSQGVFKTLGDDSYVHVIMPMFVQW
ncbi:MAG TPA: DNA polymerase III subunit beta [Dehalococcoidia bacterium]|nr:DNA polymerase III subunit beta [Dehalococcoidia bacterium]